MTVSKKKKLLEFVNNNENRQLTILFFTIVTYAILFVLFKNVFVLLFGYLICFIVYSKLFDYLVNKFRNSFKENDTNKDLL